MSNWYFSIKTMVMGESFFSSFTTPFENPTIRDRTKPQLFVPVAMAGFRKVRWEVSSGGSSEYGMDSLHMAYCIPTGSVCSGIDDYPPVKEGQRSYAACPEGYRGYAFRVCSNGQLSAIQLDYCKELNPVDIPVPDPAPSPSVPIYDPFIFGDNCYYDVQETCYDDIISDIDVLKRYLNDRDAFPTEALKHTRVLALSGMTLPSIALFR